MTGSPDLLNLAAIHTVLNRAPLLIPAARRSGTEMQEEPPGVDVHASRPALGPALAEGGRA